MKPGTAERYRRKPSQFALTGQRLLTIGIDARALLRLRTGVERMVSEFISALATCGDRHRYVLFVDRPLDHAQRAQLPHAVAVESVRFPRLQKFFDVWLAFQLRKPIRELGIDLFYSPNTKLPIAPVRRYTTVHGLEWYFYPAGYRLHHRLKQWFWFQLCTRWSAGIVTFASNTLTDIRKVRPRCKTPVCVVPEGVGAGFQHLAVHQRSPETLARCGVRTPFILSVCSLEPRKNLATLLRAFATGVRQHGLSHQLVLVGQPMWRAGELVALASRLGIQDRISFAGFVSDDDLVQLYNQAALFVYPSKYEGFGLPVLEAMACGVPVVTSRCSSLPEVAGNAAILIDPNSEDDLLLGILSGLNNQSLRSQLIRDGFQRTTLFSWEAMTRRICRFIAEGKNSDEPAAALGE